MTATYRWVAVLLLAAGGLASRVSGQASGVPVRPAGGAQGVGVGVDVGFGRKDPGAGGVERSRAAAFSGHLGFGPVGLSVGVARSALDPDTGPTRNYTTLMVGAAVTIIGGPLVPLKVSWIGGADRPFDGGSQRPWRGYLGLGASLTIPATVVSIRPWLAPRVEYLGNQPGGEIKGALSAGVDLGLLNGFGLRVSYDSRLGWDNGNGRATGIGIGASYHFR